MNVDDAEEYKAKDHSVDTREIELDEVISQIKDDPHFNESVDVVDKWDEASKQAVANDPTLLSAIHSQVSNGIYAKVSTVVASERVFGRLQGLSDIQAYQTVGQQLAQTGAFNDILPQSGQSGEESTGTGKEESSKRNDQKRRDKRRAASPTRKSSSKKKKPVEPDFNPLSMSDDEFMQQGDAKYL